MERRESVGYDVPEKWSCEGGRWIGTCEKVFRGALRNRGENQMNRRAVLIARFFKIVSILVNPYTLAIN